MAYIRSFKINKLFGYKTIDINAKSDCIILVGENGSGKSTVMNCLSYVLKKKFDELAKINFESIEIVFRTGRKFIINRNDIVVEQPIKISLAEKRIVNSLFDKLDIEDFGKIIKVYEENNSKDYLLSSIIPLLNSKKLLTSRYDSDSVYNCLRYVYYDFKAFRFGQSVEELNKYLLPSDQIFHLTTYRRVETVFHENSQPSTRLSIRRAEAYVEDVDSNKSNSIVYGMKDVKQMLTRIQDEINERNRVGFKKMMVSLLDKMVFKPDHQHNISFDLNKVVIVLSRLGNELSDDLRKKIEFYCQQKDFENNELSYLIEELIKLYEQQVDLDRAIGMFVERCNKYLKGKQFEYDVANVMVSIRSSHNEDILDLDMLSSGEKQMIGLMAKMYLSEEKEFIVLIDEPELSLSIQWQESILEDMMQSGKVMFLFAVTHSPFIYDNSLAKYAVGMSNFVKNLE